MSIPKKLAATAAVLAAVGSFVSFGVFSAFSDTKTNTSDLRSATFGLTQAPASGLLDTILNLIPGDTLTRCVKLTNSGNVPVSVTAKPNIANVDAGTLRAVLGLTLQEVTGIAANASDADVKNCVGAVAGAYEIGSAGLPILGPSLADEVLAGNGPGGRWDAGETHFYRVFLTLPSTVTDLVYAGDQVDAAVNFLAEQLPGSAR